MRNPAKDRLVVGGLILAAPLIVLAVPWAHEMLDTWVDLRPRTHLTLETSLNLFWALLALTAFLQWMSPHIRRRHRLQYGFVRLIFAFALLFPFISANDDLAEAQLINDAMTSQSLAKTCKADKQAHRPTGLADACLQARVQFTSPVARSAEEPLEAIPISSFAAVGEATGNHSPPLC